MRKRDDWMTMADVHCASHTFLIRRNWIRWRDKERICGAIYINIDFSISGFCFDWGATNASERKQRSTESWRILRARPKRWQSAWSVFALGKQIVVAAAAAVIRLNVLVARINPADIQRPHRWRAHTRQWSKNLFSWLVARPLAMPCGVHAAIATHCERTRRFYRQKYRRVSVVPLAFLSWFCGWSNSLRVSASLAAQTTSCRTIVATNTFRVPWISFVYLYGLK